MTENIQLIIDQLNLEPHPEGGFYKETYRSSGTIPSAVLPNTIDGDRNYSTCIYFLLTSENFSAFHKINQDEIWHHYTGDQLKLHMLSPDGKYSFISLGKDFSLGEIPQYVVPAGYYFAAEVPKPDSFVLTGCTVSPGFDFKDFTMPTQVDLIKQYPDHPEIIKRLTRT